MIYTDGIHMVADSLKELHNFAKRLGIRPHWFEGVKRGHPHYDIPAKRWKEVMRQPNVRIVNSRVVVDKSKAMMTAPN